MKYGQWVEKVWLGICAEAEQGPLGTRWNTLVSDSLFDEIGVFSPQSLEVEDRNNILLAIEQAASLLRDKGLFKADEAGITLTEYGVQLKGASPLALWREIGISERSAQFLNEAAVRLVLEDPVGLFVMRKPPGTILVKELFSELGWDFTDGRWQSLKSELLRYFLLEPVHSTGDVEVRITERGMLYASYAY